MSQRPPVSGQSGGGRARLAISAAELRRRRAQSMRDKAAAAAKAAPRRPPARPARRSGVTQTIRPGPPTGLGYYDAFETPLETACFPAAIGMVTPVLGAGIMTSPGTGQVTTSFGVTNARLIVFNPGSSNDIVGYVYHFPHASSGGTSVGSSTPVAQAIRCPQFDEFGPVNRHHVYEMDANTGGNASAPSFSHPNRRIENVPLRGSIRVTNVTEMISTGGTVRFLRYSGSLSMRDPSASNASHDEAINQGAISAESFFDICQLIRTTGHTRRLEGSMLKHSHQMNSHPADFARSMTFSPDTSFEECIKSPKYSTCLILIDDFISSAGGGSDAVNNTYEISVRVQRAARFGMGSILHSLARTLPVPTNHHAYVKHEADKGSNPAPVGQQVMIR